MLHPIAFQLWIRQTTAIIKSIAINPSTDQLYFGRNNGQVVILDGSGFQTGIIPGWPTSFPGLTIGADRFFTFSPDGELIYTPATFSNGTVELAEINLITSEYNLIRPFPGLMENPWSSFKDTFYYGFLNFYHLITKLLDGPIFGDYTTGVTTNGFTSGQITTSITIQTSGKLTTSPLTTSPVILFFLF